MCRQQFLLFRPGRYRTAYGVGPASPVFLGHSALCPRPDRPWAGPMTVRRDPAGAGSLQRLAALCGVLAGVGGLMHSVGEILQGSTPPVSIVFDSWVDEPFATNLGGEPAMTLVPNLLLTGILTIVASLAVVVWSAAGTGRAGYGRVLFLLS